jgi:hypothetical protein
MVKKTASGPPTAKKDLISIKYGGYVFSETGFLKTSDAAVNTFCLSDAEDFKKAGKFPTDIEVFVPNDTRISIDWYSYGWFPFYVYPFSLGMKMPFPDLVLDFIRITQLSPGQMNAMIWNVLLSIDAISKKHGLEFRASDLTYQYEVRPFTSYLYTLRSRSKPCDLVFHATSDAMCMPWSDKFLFVKKDSLGAWAVDIPDKFAAGMSSFFPSEIFLCMCWLCF